jgi:NDP-sugar pyrophosphorylase family protein
VLVLDEQSNLKHFHEKPKNTYNVSMGVYALNHRVLDHIPSGQLYGFDKLMLDLLHKKLPVAVRPFDGYWLDIGRPDDYMIAIDEFELMRARFLKP